MGLPNQAWLCLDLYDVLSRMTEAGQHSAVHHLLDSPIKNCPEVCVCGLLFKKLHWLVSGLQSNRQLLLSCSQRC